MDLLLIAIAAAMPVVLGIHAVLGRDPQFRDLQTVKAFSPRDKQKPSAR